MSSDKEKGSYVKRQIGMRRGDELAVVFVLPRYKLVCVACLKGGLVIDRWGWRWGVLNGAGLIDVLSKGCN